MKHKSSSGGGGMVALSLLAGAGVGVLAGMLLAPEKGKDLRRQVANSASRIGNQMSDSVKQGYSAGKERANSWMNKSRESGNREKSPYTDTGKWDDQENRNMTDTARNTPGV
ncbi:MAG: YtxH domain-containing protein [Hymenobacteraceae bacterium]|nr:YtxH domain-containing protein [Hymenobacteraceae bacterium]